MGENVPVTLLMPVYNSPDLFCALESVLRQTYRPIQFILVDDASERFEEERIRALLSQAGDGFSFTLLRNPENRGTVRSLNRALALAEGKYVFGLAGDDAFYDERVLADWVAAFERTDCEVLTARRAVCDSRLQEVLELLPSEKAVAAIERYSSGELFEYLARENQISGSCTAWRLDAIRRLGLFDESYRLLEDHPAYLKLLRAGGRIRFFDRIVVRYRSGGVSAKGRCIPPCLERDFVQMYRQEILPYVKRPLAARCRLALWQRGVRFDRRYYGELEEPGLSDGRRRRLNALYYWYHPTRLPREWKEKRRKENKTDAVSHTD